MTNVSGPALFLPPSSNQERMMAWTNLSEIMSEKGILGCVPEDAMCRVIAGNSITRPKKKKKRKKTLKTGLKILLKKVQKKLIKIDGKKMTVALFTKKCKEFTQEMEWTFTSNCRLVQYRGPFSKNGEMVWQAVVQLDLKGWLMQQDEDTITKIAKEAFMWRQDGADMAVKFYEALGRVVPDGIRPNIKVAI